jgi:outer membrane lipoprotein-sorting protein
MIRLASRVSGLWFAGVLCSLVLAGCAQRAISLPTGTGEPLPDFAAIHAEVSKSCAAVRTLTAELALSGRAAGQKVRGRALAGFQAPDAMRLEGLAPFGAPAFILVTSGREATLLLPRDHRVLRDAGAEEILGALTGVSLGPADLQAILTGCAVPAPKAVNGAQYGADWRSIELQDAATIYLRRVRGTWQLRAAVRGPWHIEYAEWQGAFPRSVRLVHTPSSSTSARQGVDIRAEISQLETNVALGTGTFTVDVPGDAIAITLDELHDAGPLRGTSSR